MNIYHIFISRKGKEGWIALGLCSHEQARLLAGAFPEVSRIETRDGNEVYRRETRH